MWPTEAQNGRDAEFAKRSCRQFCSAFLPTPEQKSFSGPCLMGFSTSQGVETLQPVWAICSSGQPPLQQEQSLGGTYKTHLVQWEGVGHMSHLTDADLCCDEAAVGLPVGKARYSQSRFCWDLQAGFICDTTSVEAPSPGSGCDYFDEQHSYITSLLEFNWHKEQNMEEVCAVQWPKDIWGPTYKFRWKMGE